MNDECEKVHPRDQQMIIFHIDNEIRKGNFELARNLKRDALEYLKESNKDYKWLEEVDVPE